MTPNRCNFYKNNDIYKAIKLIKKAAPINYLGSADKRTDKTYGNMTDTVADQNAREGVYNGVDAVQTVSNFISKPENPTATQGMPHEVVPTNDNVELRGQNIGANGTQPDFNQIKKMITEQIGKGISPQEAQTVLAAMDTAIKTGETVQPHVQNIIKKVTGFQLPTFEVGSAHSMISGTSKALSTGTNVVKAYNNGVSAVQNAANGNYVDAAGDAANAVNATGKAVQGVSKVIDATEKVFDKTQIGAMANKAQETLSKIPGFSKVKAITNIAEIGAIIKDPSIKSFLEHAPSVADGLAQLGIKTAGPIGEIIATYKAGQDLGEWVANKTGMADAAWSTLPEGYKESENIINQSPDYKPTTMDKTKVMANQFGRAANAELQAAGDYVNTVGSPEHQAVLAWYNKKHGTNYKAMTIQMYDEAWKAGATPTQVERREKERKWQEQEKQRIAESRAKYDEQQKQIRARAEMDPVWGLRNGVINEREYKAIIIKRMREQAWLNREKQRTQKGQAGPAEAFPTAASHPLDYYIR